VVCTYRVRAPWHSLELYTEVYGPMGVEYQIAFTPPSGPGRPRPDPGDRAGG
jgi:hypothetical protein